MFPIQNNKIIISNFEGAGFGGNGKYLANALLEQSSDYDIVWLVRENLQGEFPEGIRTVTVNSLSAVYELVTARVWIDNCRKLPEVRKRKKQFYLNTGHGGIPLKKIEKDAQSELSSYYLLRAKNDSKMLDLMPSNSNVVTSIIKNSYWYEGEVVECGIPRTEVLLKENKKMNEKIREYYKIKKDTQILLYAPTFRKKNSLKAYDIDFSNLKDALAQKFGKEWVVLFRLHPNLSNKIKNISNNSNVIDATNYPDMQELMIASNILITDYSSTMFEYLHTNNPVFVYATDIEEYDRGFYFELQELPFAVATSNDQLLENIKNFSFKVYKKNIGYFKNEVGLVEKYGAANELALIIKNRILF